MISRDHACLMADYNAWMNQRIYALCATMTDPERRQERGAFFGSLHATLNHIMVIDLMFEARFGGNDNAMPAFDAELFATFAEMHDERLALDTRIKIWTTDLTETWLGRETTFTSVIDGRRRTLPLWVFVTQMFNHQTHHRGQATTLLSQMGHDVGVTDIPFMDRWLDPET